ncbi:MAG: helicase DnaB [Anaerolineae bacterium]|nr:helicase DnaB [Anaerolineae bacterium]
MEEQHSQTLPRDSDLAGTPDFVESPWQAERPGPASLREVMGEVESQVANGNIARYIPLPTGFCPLDDVLNGGLRPGELLMLGGPFGVGKTIFGLQTARNAVYHDPTTQAIYVCFEHDRAHLMARLMCLESVEQGLGEKALTLRKMAEMAGKPLDGAGVITLLQANAAYLPLLQALDRYSDRLVLIRASSSTSTLAQIESWVREVASPQTERILLIIDYLQKIPIGRPFLRPSEEVTTYLAHGLKELAMSLGIRVIAIAASDRPGLQAMRMRLAHLRGSSALQYEADVGIVLNNKYDIVSREHLVYNLAHAEAMRSWIVFTVEKNRAGVHAVDMEHRIDAAHFRMDLNGRFVRERLVDEKVIRE